MYIKEMLAPGIWVYRNAMPNAVDLHKDIEDACHLNAVTWELAKVTGSENAIETNQNSRNTHIIGVPYNSEILNLFNNPAQSFACSMSNLLLENIRGIEHDYASMHGLQINGHESYSILKYGVGQFFVNHIDDHKNYPRRVSWVYYINDDYEGGEIEFPRFNISYKPKAGDLLLFPSSYVYNHSVKEVTSGERYAIVSWLT